MPTKYHTQRESRGEEMLDNTDLNVVKLYKFVTVFYIDGGGVGNPKSIGVQFHAYTKMQSILV